MCGVSVLCLGGDTACAVSLSVVWLETFVCACFSYRYFHVIVFVLSVFFIIVYIFCKFDSAFFIYNLNLTVHAVYICIDICIYVWMYVWMYIYIYILVYTHLLSAL